MVELYDPRKMEKIHKLIVILVGGALTGTGYFIYYWVVPHFHLFHH